MKRLLDEGVALKSNGVIDLLFFSGSKKTLPLVCAAMEVTPVASVEVVFGAFGNDKYMVSSNIPTFSTYFGTVSSQVPLDCQG